MTDIEDRPGSDSEIELAKLVQVDEIVTAAMVEARAGRRVDVDAIVSEHSAIGEELRLALGGVASLERAASRTERELAQDNLPASIGPYEVVRELGRGGMGLVYEARDDSLDRRVAIKVLTAQVSGNRAFVERFKREAHAAARLEHPNVVPVYGVDEANGQHYFAMKYVDGYGLDALTSLYSKSQGRVASGSSEASALGNDDPEASESRKDRARRRAIASDLADGRLGHFEGQSGDARRNDLELPSLGRSYHRNVARIGLGVASALGYAHERGVLHRDVKPGNILLDGQGHVWVADFGLAKIDESDDLTREGDFVGTLRYMAPEQFQGHAEPRSDLYGLGLVLYELLTLGRALQGDSRAELVHQLLYTVPTSPDAVRPEVPQDLSRIVMKAIEKLPGERYRSAADMEADLRAFLEGRPIAARAPSALYLARLAVDRNRPLFVTIMVLVLLLMLGAAAYVQQLQDSAKAEAILAYRGQLAAAASSLQNADVPTVQQRLGDCPEELRGWEWRHLTASADQSLRIVARTQNPIQALRHAGDKLLIGHRGAAILIDGEDREEVILPGMKLGPKETLAVWKLADGWLSLHFRTGLWWSPEGGYPKGDLPDAQAASEAGLHHLPLAKVATVMMVNEKESLAVVVERSGSIHVVDLVGKEILRSAASGQSSVDALAMSADGSRVWVGATGGNVRVWDTSDLTSKQILSLAGAVNAIALSPDEQTIAVGTSDHSIYLLKPSGDVRAQLIGHKGSVSALAYSPDGRTIASLSKDRSLRLWDADGGEQIQVLIGNARRGRSLYFSPDGRSLYSGNIAGIVQEWQVGQGGGRAALQGHLADVTAVDFAVRGDRFASGGRDATIRVHDAASLRLDTLILGHPSELMGLVWHDDDRQILSTDRIGHVMNWDAESGELLWRQRITGLTTEPILLPATTPGTASHGPLACFGADSGELQIVRLSDGQAIVTAKLAGESVSSVGAALDGQSVFVGTARGDLLSMDSASLDTRGRVEGLHGGAIDSIAYLKESDRLVTASLDGALAFLDAGTLKRVSVTRSGGIGHSWHTDGLEDIAVSPDGRLLAVASHSQLVRLIEASSGTIVLDLIGHESWVRRLAFAPDGNTLVSTGSSSSVRVWDTTSSTLRKERIDERLDLEMAAEAMLESWIGRAIRDIDDVEAAFEELRRRPGSHEELERAARAVLHQFRSDHLITALERGLLSERHELFGFSARQFVKAWIRLHPLTYEVARLRVLVAVRGHDAHGLPRHLKELERLDDGRLADDLVVAAMRIVLARQTGDTPEEQHLRADFGRLAGGSTEASGKGSALASDLISGQASEPAYAADCITARRILDTLAPE